MYRQRQGESHDAEDHLFAVVEHLPSLICRSCVQGELGGVGAACVLSSASEGNVTQACVFSRYQPQVDTDTFVNFTALVQVCACQDALFHAELIALARNRPIKSLI